MAQKFREKILQGSGFSNIQFESEYGMNLLKKMGWSEGKGLGKEERGMVNPIQTKRREVSMGLGFSENEKFKWNNNWWENSYNNAIKGLNLDFDDNENEATNDSSDDEEENGPNQNRLKRRKNRLNYDKKEKKATAAKKSKKVETESESSDSEEEVEVKKTSVLPNSKKIMKKPK